MGAGRPKGSVREFLVETDLGAIEALNMVDGVYRSFNILKRTGNKRGYSPWMFYKSAYKLETAIKHLNNI